jgi:hypothetical protein
MVEDEFPTAPPKQTSEGRERRRRPRASGSSRKIVGQARLLQRVSHHYPSLRPNGWYKVMEHHPEALVPRTRRGYVWIEVDGRPRQVWAEHFEVQLDTGGGS